MRIDREGRARVGAGGEREGGEGVWSQSSLLTRSLKEAPLTRALFWLRCFIMFSFRPWALAYIERL